MTSPQPLVVVITGASSGIGEACARHLAGWGMRVYGLSRRVPALTPSLPQLTHLVADVTDDQSVNEAIRGIYEAEGRIDVLINNAGSGLAGAVEDTSPAEALRLFEVNLFGVLRLTRAVLPGMRARRSGMILNIGSIGGLLAIPFQGLYSASKFALEGLTESLRLELRGTGVRVVLLEPGDHATGFTASRTPTAASTTNPAYAVACARAIARMSADESSGPSPDRVARLVLRLLQTEHPRLRHTVGPLPQRAAVWLKRLSPYALVERILAGYYGVR